MQASIYFVAIIPDDPVLQEVTAFQEYAKSRFQSAHALRAPAHITLIAPFRYQSEELPRLRAELKSFATQNNAFEIQLENFDAFPPRVIFVDVKAGEELWQLQHELAATLEQNAGIPIDRRYPDFHPHMTIAFKDLKQDIFPLAWAHFNGQEYRQQFMVRAIWLLRHEDRRWHRDTSFSFQVEK